MYCSTFLFCLPAFIILLFCLLLVISQFVLPADLLFYSSFRLLFCYFTVHSVCCFAIFQFVPSAGLLFYSSFRYAGLLFYSSFRLLFCYFTVHSVCCFIISQLIMPVYY